jgi:hypothetical protein
MIIESSRQKNSRSNLKHVLILVNLSAGFFSCAAGYFVDYNYCLEFEFLEMDGRV